jgi:hypothetical protein
MITKILINDLPRFEEACKVTGIKILSNEPYLESFNVTIDSPTRPQIFDLGRMYESLKTKQPHPGFYIRPDETMPEYEKRIREEFSESIRKKSEETNSPAPRKLPNDLPEKVGNNKKKTTVQKGTKNRNTKSK